MTLREIDLETTRLMQRSRTLKDTNKQETTKRPSDNLKRKVSPEGARGWSAKRVVGCRGGSRHVERAGDSLTANNNDSKIYKISR